MGGIFFGRSAEISMLHERLVKSLNTVLSGEAGVGKSALVKKVLNRLVGEENEWLAASPYPDGIVFLDMHASSIDIEKIWHQLADRLNGRDFMVYASAQERATFACNEKRFLLVLDFVESLGDDPVSTAVPTILKVFSPENRYLILTCRAKFGSQTMRLRPMSMQEADALLDFVSGNKINASLRQRVLRLTDGNPRKICQVGLSLARDENHALRITEWERDGLLLFDRYFGPNGGRESVKVIENKGIGKNIATSHGLIIRANVSRVYPDPFPLACCSAWGDDQFGLWCEVDAGDVVQRLRWVEPGVFWMGSTEDERDYFASGDDDWKNLVRYEAPRHLVRLTEGFWLADTVCTQAFWQEVVGDRLGKSKGASALPVEQVSWDDVTGNFLRKLSNILEGAKAFLPTEAQWEYACRAGTKTAYSFGNEMLAAQGNSSGKRSMPVKAFPANRWGLHQMHGNVWEWCADALRIYTDDENTDPDGGQDSPFRIIRGGSWGHVPRRARSASRAAHRHDDRRSGVSFRFALRFIEPSGPS